MSEVLGDAEPSDDRSDSDGFDDYEYDDGFAEHGAVHRALASVLTPVALAIAGLAIAVTNLLDPLPSYLAAALAFTHSQDPLFEERAVAVAQIVTALIAAVPAGFAIRNAAAAEEAERRLPRALAGAAVLVATLSGLQAFAGLILLAHSHVPAFG